MHTGMPFIYLNLMKAEIQCLISCLALASECNDTQMGKTQSQKQDLSLHHLQIGKTNKIMFSIVCYPKFLVMCVRLVLFTHRKAISLLYFVSGAKLLQNPLIFNSIWSFQDDYEPPIHTLPTNQSLRVVPRMAHLSQLKHTVTIENSQYNGTEKVAHQLKTAATLAGDPCLVSSTHMTAHNCL